MVVISTVLLFALATNADSFMLDAVLTRCIISQTTLTRCITSQTTPSTIPVKFGAKRRTVCNAKLNKISSNYDLDAILSNEKKILAATIDEDEEDTVSTAVVEKLSRGRKPKNDQKKKLMKQELKQMKLKQRTNDKPGGINNGYDESSIDNDGEIDYVSLFQNVNFSVYEVPPHLSGSRIDAVLVDLLNRDSDTGTNPVSISRSQCGTLISAECVFVVQPDDVDEFMNARKKIGDGEATMTVSHELIINQNCTPIHRKSHVLEPSSIIIYPSRDSLLSTSSSSTLLSNFISPTEIIAQNIPLNILFEDEYMIVINKQAGMVVHPAAGNWDGTVVNALAYYLMNESPFGTGEFFNDESKEMDSIVDSSCINNNNNEVDVNQNDAVTNSISTLRPGIVHRLDKGTTGVLVVAKTSSTLATLSEAFANRKVKKQYLAITVGNPGEDQWIDKPIGRHPMYRQRMRVVPNPSRGQHTRLMDTSSMSVAKTGRPALSHLHTIHHDGKLSIVQVRIATGRTHQIRVHLQDHGTPIYGDDVYGLTDWNKALSTRRGITRPLLHAQRLEIDHPVTGKSLVFEAPVANDMLEVMNAILPAGETI
jgi:23S rRNA pseudouridine1911/1915/1917 synthase